MTRPSLTASYFFRSFVTGPVFDRMQIFGYGGFGSVLVLGVVAYGRTLLGRTQWFAV